MIPGTRLTPVGACRRIHRRAAKAEHDVAEPVQHLLSSEGSGPLAIALHRWSSLHMRWVESCAEKCGSYYRLASVQNDRSWDGR